MAAGMGRTLLASPPLQVGVDVHKTPIFNVQLFDPHQRGHRICCAASTPIHCNASFCIHSASVYIWFSLLPLTLPPSQQVGIGMMATIAFGRAHHQHTSIPVTIPVATLQLRSLHFWVKDTGKPNYSPKLNQEEVRGATGPHTQVGCGSCTQQYTITASKQRTAGLKVEHLHESLMEHYPGSSDCLTHREDKPYPLCSKIPSHVGFPGP